MPLRRELSPDGTVGVVRLPLTELAGRRADRGRAPSCLDPRGERRQGGGAARRARRQTSLQNAQQGEISSEAVGLAIAAGVLLLTFGSVVAAGLPLAAALFGLGISSALARLLAAVTDVPDWAPAMSAMVGIGVGVDYALLIVTRFRAALADGPRHSLPRSSEAVATAGRSILIAGTTVVISLLGLFLMGLTYLYGAALATIAAVLVVMLASVTLVPALLAIAGPAGRPAAHPRDGASPRAGGARRPRCAGAAWSSGAPGPPPRSPRRRAAAARRARRRPPLRLPRRGNDAPDATTRRPTTWSPQRFGAGANGSLMRSPRRRRRRERTAR